MSFTAFAQDDVAPDNVEANLRSGAAIRLQQRPEKEANIKLDGLLTEAAWADVPAYDDMRAFERFTRVQDLSGPWDEQQRFAVTTMVDGKPGLDMIFARDGKPLPVDPAVVAATER